MNETSTNYVVVTELQRLLKENNVTLIDARTSEEFDEGHVVPPVYSSERGSHAAWRIYS